MKHVLFFLFFTFTISSSDYYQPINNVHHTKINFNPTQSNPSSFQYGFKSSHAPHYNYPTRSSAPAIENITLPAHNNIVALPEVYEAINQRNKKLEQFIYNNPDSHTIFFKKYLITEASKRYLSLHNIDINTFELCEGNHLQHAIHHEFITLTDTTAHLLNDYRNSEEIKELTKVIAGFTTAGITLNQLGEVSKAIALANAGWAILDCIQAAGEGIIEGLSSMGHSIMHPVETIQNFTYAAINCGYYCGIALKEMDCATDAIMRGDFHTAHKTYTVWSEQFKKIALALSAQCQELTLRDAIKAVTRSAIESYATTRAINGFSNLFKLAHHSAAQIAKKINHGVQESTLLISAEGIPVRIAQEVITQAEKLPRAQDKLLQVLSQFNSQKIKVGKITCLLDRKGLKHILERHHPKYWKGKIKPKQTFFREDTPIPEIVKIIKQVIKQNRKSIIEKGTNSMYQIHGIIKDTKYTIGFEYGRIGQFFISLNQ